MIKRDVEKFIKDNKDLINNFPNTGVLVLDKLIDRSSTYEEGEWIGLAAILLLLNNDRKYCTLVYYQIYGTAAITYMDKVVPLGRLGWFLKISDGLTDPEEIRKIVIDSFLSDEPIINELAKDLINNIILRLF